MRSTTGWQADGPTKLHEVPISRRDLRRDDIAVRVDFCGVCHTDLHAVRGHNGEDVLVPGHEFTGVVIEIGPDVTAFRVGDSVAVGNIVDSCGVCTMCTAGQENFCREFPTLTYGGTDRHDGTTTLGGFSREYVVRDRFVHPLPSGLDPAAAAPLLCAGITVWEPLRALGVGPGTRVAVAGLGGLDAIRLGARDVVVSTDPDSAAASRDRFDVLIDTIPVAHDLAPYLRLVAVDGTLSQVGYLGAVTVETMDLLIGRKKLSSGGSGGLPATTAMLEFCAARGIVADVETLPSARVTEALDRLERGDVRYRFVLDLSDLD
ncbi:NAD(P)-dependent alcohol dehydrogenase [Lentzea sp. BCCO 10_0061]|uniref:alcohol dehydrogenase (NADP(+)) n=1 Tax=Lentzea sokolovensis TaxID=3095429 RepID=A0ABU4V9T9_9PSEU|nr:NAD(P)-dependent alcohol dehydrogenase [Lentzea sp. BCCO 10_0061]MDX8148551.1 NAD(P)-dependent alcohol dehydrogenase [Lentzea sp. BCCO 10_0061]